MPALQENASLPAIFPARGHAAADVALGLVHVQYRFYLIVQRAVEFRQTFAQIFMDRGFADAEFLSGGADGGPVLYDVLSERDGTLLDVSLQATTLPACFCSNLCRAERFQVVCAIRKASFCDVGDFFTV